MKIFSLLLSLSFFYAEGHVGGSIAVLNVATVLTESKASKNINEQIDAINNESKKGFSDLESKIKSIESSKKSDYDTRKIEDMQIALYEMIRAKKYQISEWYRKAIVKLEDAMKAAVSEICKKKGIAIVINTDAVIFLNENCVDITTEVIGFLDKACSHIDVEIEESK